ncbi:MAG: dihydrolipoyl dehydrogenase [Magnetovibrio sp.]|nr:dihydrolipoyl dehydrogenase [Magnetovibrio sp.]
MSNDYDLIVIGAGPGGYVSAIRAAQLGLKTAIIEKRETLGGTCLNIGCIPSKALLNSSHHYEMAEKEFVLHGINISGLKLDLNKMLERKEETVADLTKGIEFLMKKNKIDCHFGKATIIKPGQISIRSSEKYTKNKSLRAASILIATGSDITPLEGVKINEKQIVSSTGALSLSKVPKSLTVIGAGVIGLELGSVWRRLGADVTVVEYLDLVLPGMDTEISKNMRRILTKQGMKFKMGTKVTAAKVAKESVNLTVEPRTGGEKSHIQTDVVLVAIGRSPNTKGLGLEKIGVDLDKRGFITVDEDFQTNVEGIYAIGDVVGGAMLAHKAEDEGVVCVEILAGQTGHIDYDSIPGIVYTHPEVASCGKTEEMLIDAGVEYNAGKFPFAANSRARCNADTAGFVKILSDKLTDRVLGCHIIGPSAGDLIQEVVNVMEFGGSAEDIARICHGHPGLPEAIKEAALATSGRSIHI